MGRTKYDYEPLLPPGRHVMTLWDVERKFVEPLDDRPARQRLYVSLEEMVQEFLRASIPCEFLIDGSFVTRKPRPEDVDVAVRVDWDVYDELTPDQIALVSRANDPEFLPGLDTFSYVAYPRDHPNRGTAADDGETWAEQWGSEHSKRWIKGIAVIRLGETNVGHRLRRT
jgi:hypothetical protein